MKKLKLKNLYIVLLLLLILFHCVNNYIWLSKDNSPLGLDTIPNLNDQAEFYNKFKFISSEIGIKVGLKNLFHFYSSLLSIPDCRTMFMYLVASISSILFGFSLFTIRMTNLIYFIILIISVYFIGKKILNEKAGLIAAFIVSFYPSVFAMSRQFEHDFPTTAMVALCICFLFYSEGFRIRKYSLFFGIALGFGILFRGQTLFFVIGPLSYILYRAFLKNKHRELIRIFNLIFSISLVVLISSVWWRGLEGELLNNFLDHAKVFYVSYTPSIRYCYDCYEPIRLFSIKCFFYYLFYTVIHISLFYSLIFLIGLFAFLKSKIIKEKMPIMLWIIIPYIIFTLISSKAGRYYFPSFSAIALISAAGILSLKQRIIKVVLITVILFIGMIQFFRLSYELHKLPNLSVQLDGGLGIWNTAYQHVTWCSAPKVNVLYGVIDDFAKIIKSRNSAKQVIRVGVISKWSPEIKHALLINNPEMKVRFDLDITALPDFLIVSDNASGEPNYELLKQKYEEWIIGEKKGLNGQQLIEAEKRIAEKGIFINKLIEKFKEYAVLDTVSVPWDGRRVKLFLTRDNNRSIDFKKDDREISIAAEDFYNSHNIVIDSLQVPGAIIAESRKPCLVEYRFVLPSSGEYILWTQYATADFRPMDIFLNNQLIIKNGLGNTTGSYYSDTLAWFREEGVLRITQPGEYSLRLTSDNDIPHIKTIMIKKLQD